MFDDDVDEIIRAWRRRGMGTEMGGGATTGIGGVSTEQGGRGDGNIPCLA